jgi:hypothetical protein
LANATSNSTYIDTAFLSFQFINSSLYSERGEVFDGISADMCGVTNEIYIQGLALFLEGTTLLGVVTQNDTLRDL